MPVYIYALKCPIEGIIRYIGKSINPERRLICHIIAARNYAYDHHTARWIRKLLAQGLKPDMEILEEVPEGIRWQDVERSYIARADVEGWRLTNSTAGGEGLDYANPEDRARYLANLSAAMKELWNRPERRLEASVRSLRAHADPEISARRRASLVATFSTPEAKARLSAAVREVNSRPEVKKKKSQSMKKVWEDAGYREKWEKTRNSEECRQKLSDAAQQRWSDPEHRKAMTQLINTPEIKARQIEGCKRRSTPEYLSGLAERTKRAWQKDNTARIENIRASRYKEGVRESISAGNKAAWADPEKRAKRMASLQTPEQKAIRAEAQKKMWATRRAKAAAAKAIADLFPDPDPDATA